MEDKFDLLRDSLEELNINYEETQIEMFIKYYEILIEWNERMNLTAITEVDEVIVKHFIDSILICDLFDFNKDISVIDVGTGAGFPGIPLKIMNPECEMVLVDSLNKRIRFLEAVIDKLGLKRIRCIHGRAEDLARNKNLRGHFDYSLSRAVANLSTLSEYCIPFLKQGGKFISYKSDKSEDEINNSKNAVRMLGSKIISVKERELPYSDIIRKFVIIENLEKLSSKYPRKAGIPSKEPL